MSLIIRIHSSVFALLFILILPFFSFSQTQTVTLTTSDSSPWAVPVNVTKMTVEALGGGGKGGSRTTGNNTGFGGGGGGAYSKKVFSNITNSSFSFNVGAGSTDNTISGENSWFDSSSSLLALGGQSVTTNSTSGAPGGNSLSCIGDISYSGGNGADGSGSGAGALGGGGGSSAGNSTNGNNGVNEVGGAAPSGGGTGGNGATRGNDGNPGGNPGGGGGGAASQNSNVRGGDGGDGQILITYSTFYLNGTSTSTPEICSGSSATISLTSDATGLPDGDYTLTYTLTGNETGTYTAPITVSSNTASFNTVPITSGSTVTITNIENSDYGNNITANNTATVQLDVTDPTITCPADIEEDLTDADFGGYWNYRKEITINNTGGALSDYQVRVDIAFESGKMNADFSDIRFRASNGTTDLDFWIEPVTGSNARAWVKVPAIAASSATTIYMYYGNVGASSVSNAANTFVFFTDVPSGSGWNTYGNGDVSFDDTTFPGLNTIRKTTDCDPDGGWISIGTTVSDFRMLVREQRASASSNSSCNMDRFGLENSSYNGYNITRAGGTNNTGSFGWERRNNGIANGGTSSTITQPMDSWYRMEMTKECTTNGIEAIFYNDDGTLVHSESSTDNAYCSFDRFVLRGGHDYFIDYIAVAEFASNDPSVSVGTEEVVSTSQCEKSIAVPAPTASDNSGSYTLVNDYNGTADASDSYPVGTTTVEYTVTDCEGNLATCSFDVTVNDLVDPVISCPGDINEVSSSNPITPPAPAAEDNCGSTSLSYSLSGATTGNGNGTLGATNFNIGTTTVSYTVTDNSNPASCSFDVNITCGATIDDYAFTPITCNGDNDASITLSGSGGSSLEYSIDGGSSYQSSNTFSNLSPGSYTLAIRDAGVCETITSTVVEIYEANDFSLSATTSDANCPASDGSIDLEISSPVSNSIFLDGNDDYIALNSSFSGINALPELTVSAWIKVNPGEGGWSVIDYDRSEYFNLSIGDNNGNNDYVHFDTSSDVNGNTDDFNGSVNVRDGQWHYITAIYDGSNKYIYVDGVLDAQKNNVHSGDPIGSSATRYGIVGDGSEAGSVDGNRNNLYFMGRIAQIETWTKALSEDEVKQRMYSDLNGSETGLFEYWKFEEGSGASVSDETGSYTGTLYNGPTWEDDAPYSYRWTKQGDAGFLETTQDLSGLDAGTYNVEVTYGSGCVKNSSYIVDAIDPDPPVVTTQPSDPPTVCAENGTITIGAEVSGNGLTYQWYENGTALSETSPYSGTTNDTLIIANPTATLDGNEYHFEVTNGCTSLNSDTVSINVEESPEASSGGSETICALESVTVSGASASNGTILWTHNGNGTLTGAATLTPTYTSVASDGGNTVILTMTVSNPPCADATATYNIDVITELPVSVSINTNPGTEVCEGEPVAFTATPVNGGSSPSYQWKLNGTDVGSDSPSYSNSSLSDGDVVGVVLTSSETCATGSPSVPVSFFSWDDDVLPLTNSELGIDAISINDGQYSNGGLSGTTCLAPVVQNANIQLTFDGTEPALNSAGVDYSVYYQRDESMGELFSRGNSLIISGGSDFNVTYRVSDGASSYTEISSSNYPIPEDGSFHIYRFVYDPSDGYGRLFVDGSEEWTSPTATPGQPMYWTGAGDLVIGSGIDASGNETPTFDNLLLNSVTPKTAYDEVTMIVHSPSATVNQYTPDNECPQLDPNLGFEPNNNGPYDAGASEIQFQIQNNSPTTDWSFTFDFSDTNGVTGFVVDSVNAAGNDSYNQDILSSSGTFGSIPAADDLITITARVKNIPGEQIEVDFNLTNISDTNGCSTGYTENRDTVIMNVMPVVGQFE